MVTKRSYSTRQNYYLQNIVFIKVYILAQVLPIPNEITSTIQRTQRESLWNSNNAETNHEIIWNDFQNGDLKNVDIPSKTCSLF